MYVIAASSQFTPNHLINKSSNIAPFFSYPNRIVRLRILLTKSFLGLSQTSF